jgi:hypothetical protein
VKGTNPPIRLLAWALLGLWALIMLNSVMYRHTHRLPNGKIVSHAHPYQKSSDGATNHEHTDEELVLLQLIDGQLFIPPALPDFSFLAPADGWPTVIPASVALVLSACLLARPGRAPPTSLPTING